MTENKWRFTAFLNLTRDQVQSSVVGSNDICVGKYGGVFYRQAPMRAFSLSTMGNGGTTSLQLMSDTVTNGCSTLPALFDGGYNCTAAGKSGTTPFSFQNNGSIDLSCMSQLQF